MRALFFGCFLFASLSGSSQLQRASLNDLQFIAGRWTLQHEWGDMEEVWSAPMGNNMMGSYRCVKDGKAVFYEFMVIEQTDSVPVLHLRHFSPGSIAWEDREAPGLYPLEKLSPNKAQFQKTDWRVVLTFTRQSPLQLQVMLESVTKEGKWETTYFDYRLQQ